MTQAQTLQDIFSEIADIKDVLCAGVDATASEVNTQVLNEISINPNDWSYSNLQLENTTNAAAVSLAQSELNELIGVTLAIAKSERLATDPTLTLAGGEIVPVATNSPIMLIPKLLKALVSFKAPLSVITKVISEILSDLLLEHIKRKLNEKNCEITAFQTVQKSKIFTIPENATQLIAIFADLPAWVGKEFADTDLNTSLILPTGSPSVDMSRYSTYHTPVVTFGKRIANPALTKPTYWYSPIEIEYSDQIIDIPESEYSNMERLVYVKAKIEATTAIAFVIPA